MLEAMRKSYCLNETCGMMTQKQVFIWRLQKFWMKRKTLNPETNWPVIHCFATNPEIVVF